MDLSLNAQRFTGEHYIRIYDQYRPAPPAAILRQTLNYLDKPRAANVVDLGCGTGISTVTWRAYADQTVGVEPSTAMSAVAEQKITKDDPIRFINAFAHALPFADASVDVVACSQSFHWMEPTSTLQEVNRILKPGGVLTIYDILWPPSVATVYELAYRELFAQVASCTQRLEREIAHFWPKDQHEDHVQNTGYFTPVKTSYYHQTEPLDKDKFLGLALSQGGLEALLKRGFTEEEVGLKAFRERLDRSDIPPFPEITYHYQVIFGVKQNSNR